MLQETVNIKHLGKFINFVFGGLFTYALKLGLTALLTEIWHIHYWLSYTVTLAIIILFAFFYNSYITYRDHQFQFLKFIKFFASIVTFMLIDFGTVALLTSVFGWHYLLSIALVTIFIYPLKFIFYMKMVFVEDKASQMTGSLSSLLQYWRTKKALPWIKEPVLEIGCGNGYLVKFMKNKEQYLGVDIQESFIENAKSKHPSCTFIKLEVGKDKFPHRKFGSIVLLAVAEHLENIDAVFLQLKKNLSPGGRIIITTPTIQADKILKTGSKFGLFSREALEEHNHYFDEEELKSLLSKDGFKVIYYSKFQFGLNQIIVGEL